MQSHSKTKGGLQDFASLTTLKGFLPFSESSGTFEPEDVKGLSKATCNQFQQRHPALKQCECIMDGNMKLLLGWELYKPRKFYVNTNKRSRSNSTDVLRGLLIDHISKKNVHGKPTALTRLIEGMMKPLPKPKFEYGNCLQQTLLFDDHSLQYKFGGEVTYSPPDIDEIYLNGHGEPKFERKNPFVEVQLCPTSLYQLMDQPLGQEYLLREETLVDPKTWSQM